MTVPPTPDMATLRRAAQAARDEAWAAELERVVAYLGLKAGEMEAVTGRQCLASLLQQEAGRLLAGADALRALAAARAIDAS